jgi:hypothetical protein
MKKSKERDKKKKIRNNLLKLVDNRCLEVKKYMLKGLKLLLKFSLKNRKI